MSVWKGFPGAAVAGRGKRKEDDNANGGIGVAVLLSTSVHSLPSGFIHWPLTAIPPPRDFAINFD